MTLVVAVSSRQSIWLMTDRRVTFTGQPPNDDARKILMLDTTDGAGVLGYCGLGSTALGSEPGEWMAGVLRGRNLPLEASLVVLAKAISAQLPPHLHQLQIPGDDVAHTVVVPAFVDKNPRLYTIDLIVRRSVRQSRFRIVRYVVQSTGRNLGDPGPGIMVRGSGVASLRADRIWGKALAKTVKAHGRGRVTDQGVAQHLAGINFRVSQTNPSVGPSCIVAWRAVGGGGQLAFNGTALARTPTVPMIARGIDMNALVGVVLPRRLAWFNKQLAGDQTPFDAEADSKELDAELAKLPDWPDEDLR